MYQQVQVVYSQGLVKTFVAPMEIRMCDFAAVAKAFGRIRSVRFQPDVDDQAARLLCDTGNATLVEAKR